MSGVNILACKFQGNALHVCVAVAGFRKRSGANVKLVEILPQVVRSNCSSP